MRIFIAGATGIIGRRLVAQFVDHGHTVVGLTRDNRGDDIVEAHGGDPYRGDLFDEESMIHGADGTDVVVHAATAIPTKDPTPEEWNLNDRVRREGAQVLTTATAEVGADQYLQQSIVWVARQPNGEAFDEDSPINPDASTQSAVDAEEIATAAGDDFGFDVGVLRCGYFYAPDAYHTRTHGQALVRGNQPIIDESENAKISRIHASDAASAFVAVAEADENGFWHAVDDEPVSAAAFSTSLSERLDAPVPKRVSAEDARAEIGDVQMELLTHPMPSSNDKLRTEVGWEPAYPTYQDGLDQVVEAWRDEEFLV